MTVFSIPIVPASDNTGATTVLKAPPGGIPAGSVVCIFTWGDIGSLIGIGDTPGNIYKLAGGQNEFLCYYTFNSKALRAGDTVTVRKNPATLLQAMGCAYTGLVNSKDPLTQALLSYGYNMVANVPVPAGDLVVACIEWTGWDDASMLFVNDATHPWSMNDFPRYAAFTQGQLSNPIFAASLNPRPAGALAWKPQFTPALPNNWLSLALGFSALATHALTAVGFSTGSPVLPAVRTTPLGKMAPVGITVGSPFIEAPTTGRDAPYVVCLTHRDDPDIMEALHTNLNVAFGLEVQPHSLVGRTADGVGMAERISVIAPLLLVDKTLTLDPTAGDEQIAAILARLAAVEDKATAAMAAIDNLSQVVSALSDAILVLQTSTAQLEAAVFGGTAVGGNAAASLAVDSPVLGKPALGFGNN